MMNEQWNKSYEKEVEIYNSFAKYEDEGNKVLKKLLSKFSFKDKIVLDIGCGSGKYVKLIAPLCKKYYALDVSKPLLNIAKKKCKNIKNVKYIHASSEKIPLKAGSVDVVFSSWGLNRLVLKKTVKEIGRVLKKGGEVWVFENYPAGAFMRMRGKTAIDMDRDAMQNREKYGMKVDSIVKTNFKFPSLKKAKRILGFIFGKNALDYLRKHPSKKIEHKIIIQHMKK